METLDVGSSPESVPCLSGRLCAWWLPQVLCEMTTRQRRSGQVLPKAFRVDRAVGGIGKHAELHPDPRVGAACPNQLKRIRTESSEVTGMEKSHTTVARLRFAVGESVTDVILWRCVDLEGVFQSRSPVCSTDRLETLEVSDHRGRR